MTPRFNPNKNAIGRWLSGCLLAFALAFSVTVAAHEAHRKNEVPPAEQVADKAGEIASSGDSDSAREEVHTEPAGFDAVGFLGRLHPAAVHFPIALLMAAAFAELIFAFRPNVGLETTVRFLVYGGAGSAVLAAALGWFAGGFRLSDRSELLYWHRWNGTGIAVASLVVALLAARQGGRGAMRMLLGLVAAALVFQGYMGAEMSLGPDHLGLNGGTEDHALHNH